MASDRERKREADRARRAAIKAGTWDFPNGGDVELARAGLPIDAPPKSGSHQAKPSVFIPPRASAPAVAPMPALPAPRSMVAIGGRPGRGLVPQGYGYPAPPDIAAASAFTKWRANTETMLAALATKVDAHEREIAALKAAQADRRADALAVAQALAGIFQAFAIRR